MFFSFLFLFYSMCAVDALNRYGFCTAPLASMHWWCIRTIRTDWGFCLLALSFEGNIQQHSIDSYFSCGRFVHMHLANDIWRDWGIHQNKQTRKKKANFIFRKPINFSFHWSTTHTSTISSSIFAFFFFFGSRSQQVMCEIEYSCGMNACNTFIPMLCEFVCLCVCVVWKNKKKNKHKKPKNKNNKIRKHGLELQTTANSM